MDRNDNKEKMVKKIEKLRREIHNMDNDYRFTSEEMIEKSQKLDKILNEFHQS